MGWGGQNSAGGGTGRIRDPRAGVWRKSYKVYKVSVFLYNNKNQRLQERLYIQNTEILLHLQTGSRPDGRQDRRGLTGRAKGARCVQEEGKTGTGFSQRQSAGGAGVAHAQRWAASAWAGARSQEGLPVRALRASAPSGVLGGGDRPVWPAGQTGRKAIVPWSLPRKRGEAGSICPSSLSPAGLVQLAALPSLPRCRRGPELSGYSELGLPAFPGQDRRCH